MFPHHGRTGIGLAIGSKVFLREAVMWNLFNCYLSGRHDYGMWCEPGAIFLRCVHCGKRSSGWEVTPKAAVAIAAPRAHVAMESVVVAPAAARKSRVLRFERAAAR
jgi:hypothetical protein